MPEILISWLLLFALFYLLLSASILIHNRIYLTELPQSDNSIHTGHPKISVCIPARNEENVIEILLKSIVIQDYENFEVLILDDQSDDRTPDILKNFKNDYPDLIHYFEGTDQPHGWLGKSWACQQLGNIAGGEIFLFVDADTELKQGMLSSLAIAFHNDNPDMVTVWPQQILKTFWEKCVLPIVYYTLFNLLPTWYAFKKPRLMPEFIYTRMSPLFAAANGQCIAFRRSAYEQIGGHESVKSNIVEDVELAKNIKRAGFSLRMYTGLNTIKCRMYTKQSEILQGFRKNFFAGFGHSLSLFIISALLHFIVFILPFITLPLSIFTANKTWFQLSVAIITIILIQRLVIALWQRWNPLYAFTHPIGVLWFQFLAFVSLSDYFTGNRVTWKKREII
ncbi:MAG: glycosyltransferase [Balneolaceae bacterium]